MKKPFFVMTTVWCLAMITIYAGTAAAYVVTFLPRLSVTQEFTDEPVFSTDGTEDEYGVTTLLSPGFTTEIMTRTAGLSVSTDPAYAFYAKHDEYNTWRHRGDASAWLSMTRSTRLELAGNYLKTDEPILEDQPTMETDTSIRRSRQSYTAKGANALISHQFGEADYLRLRYTLQSLDNDDPEIEDNISVSPNANLVWWFLPNEWGTELEGNFQRAYYDGDSDDFDNLRGRFRLMRRISRYLDGYIQYQHTVMDFDGNTENYKIYDPSLGIVYNEPESITGSLGVGYFTRDNDVSEDDSGFVMNGDLSKGWRFRTGSISIRGASGYEERYLDVDNLGFAIYWEAGLNAEYGFTRHLTGDIFATYRNDRYKQGTDRVDPEDDTTRCGTGLTQRVFPWMNLRLEYAYRLRDSNLIEREYQENRITLRLSFAPERPYRATY